LSEDETPANDNTNDSSNWEQRYKGLQKVVSTRDEALNTLEADRDRLAAEHAASIAELETYRQRDVDNSEEEAARQNYEQLRQRFEPENPRPISVNPSRVDKAGWEDAVGNPYSQRERKGTSSGWPT